MESIRKFFNYLRRHDHWGIAFALMVILLVSYLIGIGYYQTRFVPRTVVAGVSIHGDQATKAEEEIQQRLEKTSLEFTENGEALGNIQLSQLKVQSDFDPLFEELLAQQSPARWPLYFFKPLEITRTVDKFIKFDRPAAELLYQALGINNKDRKQSQDAYLSVNDDGYYEVMPDELGTQITPESLEKAIYDALRQGNVDSLDLATAYEPAAITKDDAFLNAMAQEARQFQEVKVTIKFDGHEITIPPEEIAGWILFDEEGHAYLSEEEVNDYVSYLNKEYSTRLAHREFEGTLRGWVSVDPGTLGWYLNIDEETQNILHLLNTHQSTSYEPNIYGSGYGLDDDIGASFVEVDLINQMLWIYIDYELVLETPIVSGMIGAETIPGAYSVWEKKSPNVLKDYDPINKRDYEQPVQYWVAFDDQAQGLHDASWQPTFGGDAYLQSGSLGCINISPSVMGEVYDLVEYGMPVIVY